MMQHNTVSYELRKHSVKALYFEFKFIFFAI